MPAYIDLVNSADGTSTSSLEISSKDPNVLRVVGALPHSARVFPRRGSDAQRLANWLYHVYGVVAGGCPHCEDGKNGS